MEFGLLQIWASMGTIAKLVLFVLAGLSLWSLGFLFERLWLFHKAKTQSLSYAVLISKYLKENKINEGVEEAKKHRYSHLARIVSAALLEFLNKQAASDEYDVIDAAYRAIERTTLMTTADFKRGLGSLATIASTAPFIGLLGTVVGIINAFQGMALSGSGGLGAVSAGISEALVTTAFGLFVAIPAVWIYNYFTNRVERLQVEMSNSASELVDYFIKRQSKGA
jgi:biopolymer transport protein ExbB